MRTFQIFLPYAIAAVSILCAWLYFPLNSGNVIAILGHLFLAYATLKQPEWVRWIWWGVFITPMLLLAVVSHNGLLANAGNHGWILFSIRMIPSVVLIIMLAILLAHQSKCELQLLKNSALEMHERKRPVVTQQVILTAIAVAMLMFRLPSLISSYGKVPLVISPDPVVLGALPILIASFWSPQSVVLVSRVSFPGIMFTLIWIRLGLWLRKIIWDDVALAVLSFSVVGVLVAWYYMVPRKSRVLADEARPQPGQFTAGAT